MKFSITIPAYKQKYLSEAIDSCLAQTYEDFELIIVNDASPENLDVVVNSYNDARLHYYKNETNYGSVNVVDNWNKCLSYCSGDFVICMGDDDKLLPNCLENYKDLIDKYPEVNVYHAWTQIIDEKSNIIRMQEARPERESVYSLIWSKWNNRIQYIGDFCFKVSNLRKCGGFYKTTMAWAADDITANMMAKNEGIVNSQVPMFQYRMNEQTISKIGNIRQKIKAIKEEEQWYETFFEKDYSGKDDIAYVFRNMAMNLFPKEMFKKRAIHVSKDLLDNGIKGLFFYLRNMKEYHLNTKILLYALNLYIIGKIK